MYQEVAKKAPFHSEQSRRETAVLNWCVTHPRLFPMYPLASFCFLEERAMCRLQPRVFDSRGGFVLHLLIQGLERQHLADEVDHVQWDEQVIGVIWPETSPWLRKLNVKLMDWMLREFIVAPKRAAVRVLDALVCLATPSLRASPASVEAGIVQDWARPPNFSFQSHFLRAGQRPVFGAD